VSLVDGYAYDLESASICKLTSRRQQEHQRKRTYMKDYPAIIQTVGKLSQEQWRQEYRVHGRDGYRNPCTAPEYCDMGINPEDNLGNVHQSTGLGKTTQYRTFLEEADEYCEKKCKSIPMNWHDTSVSASDSNAGNRSALDCQYMI
jgi:hypothetical protein